jgi:hypothetical protein
MLAAPIFTIVNYENVLYLGPDANKTLFVDSFTVFAMYKHTESSFTNGKELNIFQRTRRNSHFWRNDNLAELN